jgi:hypothetical protein
VVDMVMPELKNRIILGSSGVKYQFILMTPYFNGISFQGGGNRSKACQWRHAECSNAGRSVILWKEAES